MKNDIFSPEDKAACFDEIAKHFYNGNFGQMSKPDIELMMFNFYLEKLMSVNTDEKGNLDYRKCSDYRISKVLGITQQRVRNLKIKKQLVYPVDYDWKTSLARLTENARYDKATKMIVLNIPDPNLYLEIQNFIEEQGAYLEKQLNSKVLKLRVEYYIDLVIQLEDESSRESIIKELKTTFKDKGKDDKLFDENQIGKTLKTILETTADITAVASNLTGLISPGNILGKALMKLLLKAS